MSDAEASYFAQTTKAGNNPKSSRWVPHVVSEENKQRRKGMAGA